MANAEPITYPPDAILRVEDVAKWLKVSRSTVYRLPIKSVSLGHRTRRFLAADVIEYLRSIAA